MSQSRLDWVNTAVIDDAMSERCPNYRAVLVAATAIDIEALRSSVDALVARADESAQGWSADTLTDADAHLVQWHEVYRSFGVNPRRIRVSVDALLRRTAQSGLPRIGPLVDTYNALSVIYRVPIGGEDLHRYQGPARLHLAVGDEPFQTSSNGELITEFPDAGEPVWSDDIGVTCRRWNWRQTNRTAITDDTIDAGFIIDSLDAPDHSAALRCADHLCETLAPIAAITRR